MSVARAAAHRVVLRAGHIAAPLCSVALCWLIASEALAQAAERLPEGGLPEGYVRAVDLGVDEMDHGNFEEARSRFLQAHEIYPNARTLRALGKVAYELKDYRAAVGYLERSLVEPERPLTEALRQDVQVLLRKAREYVASYTIDLDPDSAQLLLDGASVELGSDRRLTVNVGRHVLEARAPGYQPLRRTLLVAGGRTESLTLRLLPGEGPAASDKPPLSATAPVSDVDKPLRKQWWVWTGVCSAIAAAVITGVVLSMRNPAEHENGGNSETVLALD